MWQKLVIYRGAFLSHPAERIEKCVDGFHKVGGSNNQEWVLLTLYFCFEFIISFKLVF